VLRHFYLLTDQRGYSGHFLDWISLQLA
jgi:hypothetical protein